MKYKIVAGIPAKNAEWIIEKQLKALLTFCDKIVISDDQSTDKTYEICKSFKNVEVYKREPHDWRDRQGGLQRQEILERSYKYNPDYFFCLDSDEIPSKNFSNWIESTDFDETINMWTFPWVHLWQDENHYRVDNYTSSRGHAIRWDPDVIGTSYRKGFLVKNIKDFKLKYDINQHRVRPSNQPINTPKPYKHVLSDPVILHYGKISDYYKTGQNFLDRAHWENFKRKTDIQAHIAMHQSSNDIATLKLRKIKNHWKW
tara:strand:+ start:248 stop:1021 length:774 start_codon:yes stop_codon:yes gene_type:complete